MGIGRLGVRERAMVLVLIASLPFAVALYLLTEEQRVQHRQRVAQQAEQLTRVVYAKFGEMIAYASEALTLAAAEEAETSGGDCTARLQRLAGASPVHSLSLADPAGRIVCSSVPGGIGVEVGDRDYFRRAISSRGFSTSGVTRGRISKRTIVLAGHPVIDRRGDLRAVLVAEVALDWVPRALAEAEAPTGFTVAIVSGAGEELLRYSSGPDPEPGAAPDIAGETRLPGPVHEPAFVRVALPAALADQPAERTLRRGLALLAGVFAFALAVASNPLL